MFLNTDESIAPRGEADAESLKAWSNVALGDEARGKGTFHMIYKELLTAVAASDIDGIHRLCEKNLATEFCEGIQWISPQVKAI